RDLGAEVSMVLADTDCAGDKITVEAQPMARPAADFGFAKILYHKEDGRATVTINRPRVYNALDFQTLREMSRAFEDASSDDSLAVAADGIYIRQADIARGAVPAGGGTQWLPLLVGDRRAREIVWLGEEISAQQALAWGLVNRVVPRAELDAAVDEMVARLKQTM